MTFSLNLLEHRTIKLNILMFNATGTSSMLPGRLASITFATLNFYISFLLLIISVHAISAVESEFSAEVTGEFAELIKRRVLETTTTIKREVPNSYGENKRNLIKNEAEKQITKSFLFKSSKHFNSTHQLNLEFNNSTLNNEKLTEYNKINHFPAILNRKNRSTEFLNNNKSESILNNISLNESALFDKTETIFYTKATKYIEKIIATNTPFATFADGISETTEMMVIDEKSAELLPLEELPAMILKVLGVGFMIIGGAIPYVFQYIEIYQNKSAVGFSLLVCLALSVANILRILFWFGKHFETPLLVQSIVMIICMILMLEISVRMNKKLIPPIQRSSIWRGDFFRAFWKWNDLSSFIFTLALFTFLTSIITAVFIKYELYVEGLGMLALFVEACLGLPQLIRNIQRRSVSGMSVKMVLMWLFGDVGKTIYFIVRKSPPQFYICSCMQITIDVLIMLQVFCYGSRSNTSRASTFSSTSPPKV